MVNNLERERERQQKNEAKNCQKNLRKRTNPWPNQIFSKAIFLILFYIFFFVRFFFRFGSSFAHSECALKVAPQEWIVYVNASMNFCIVFGSFVRWLLVVNSNFSTKRNSWLTKIPFFLLLHSRWSWIILRTSCWMLHSSVYYSFSMLSNLFASVSRICCICPLLLIFQLTISRRIASESVSLLYTHEHTAYTIHTKRLHRIKHCSARIILRSF